jgi:acyl transferase domain-containing protein/enoyl-CoA hydratase/carnithine racemase/acyl carrier protein
MLDKDKFEILQKIKNQEISQSEGLKLIEKLYNNRVAENISSTVKNVSGFADKNISNLADTSIAVIGMSGKFPGASNINEFWENLIQGTSSIGNIPYERWKVDKKENESFYYDSLKIYPWGAFLSDADEFDPLFFNISPHEARLMDPRQRLLLQEAWRALEDAGYSDKEMAGSNCGIFIGCGKGDYLNIVNKNQFSEDPYAFIGNESSILSARLSYHLNLKGVSISVDTACSSSLIATVLACENVANGRCDMAIAGGVTVLSSPEAYIQLSKTGMLSESGKCLPFDNNADGFIPGEGVGIIILKRLDSAIQSHDNIYAVIRGFGFNQDGKSNGITSPNAKSQEELECEVYKKFNINPETISYIETHGTGTLLGDPIEFQALTESFRKFTHLSNYCAIGSVKANVGHLLFAAGIAGLIKVILCLKHKTYVPSSYFSTPNRHIIFNNSPFYINQKLRSWELVENSIRRAAVSGFGFSGSNCHVVVEEFNSNIIKSTKNPCYIIPFSAKTEDALKQKLNDFSIFLEKNDISNISIQELAFTLQKGRSHFDIRLALIVTDLDDLKNQLSIICKNYDGRIRTFSEEDFIPGKNELDGMLKEISNERLTLQDYKKNVEIIAKAYEKGSEINWDRCYNTLPQKISLPTYPFAKEKYWHDAEEKVRKTPTVINLSHPFAGENTSTLKAQSYQIYLSQANPYIKDHIVKGEVIFPAAAYIEMVREVLNLATEENIYSIENINFLSPLRLKEKEVLLRSEVSIIDGITVEVEIFSIEGAGEKTKHVIARAALFQKEVYSNGSNLHFNELIKNARTVIPKENLYKIFQREGFDYKNAYQSIENLYLGHEYTVSEVELKPETTKATKLPLQPSLLDGILQSATGILLSKAHNSMLSFVPFMINGITILKELPECFYVYVRENKSVGETLSFNIEVQDNDGELIFLINDYTVRPLTRLINEEAGFYFTDAWTTFPEPDLSDINEIYNINSGTGLLLFDNNLLLKNDLEKTIKSKIIAINPGTRYEKTSRTNYIINISNDPDFISLFDDLSQEGQLPDYVIFNLSETWFCTKSDEIKSQLNISLYSLMNLCQQYMRYKPNKKIKILFLNYFDEFHPINTSLSAFSKTLYQENPSYHLKIVTLPDKENTKKNNQLILYELTEKSETIVEVSYKNVKRKIKTWQQIKPDPVTLTKNKSFFKNNGVYLITGGAGEIGLTFADYIASRFKANIYLIGRSQLNTNKHDRIKKLNESTSKVTYYTADLSNHFNLEKVIIDIIRREGKIDGILHSAGVTNDSYIIKKNIEGINKVLGPKIFGTINLDEITKDIDLDFFLLFSSQAAVFGNIGQADYAYANGFMNGFAHYRQKLVLDGERKGKTISINWPYWASGGMQVNDEKIDSIKNELGLVPVTNQQALEMFENLGSVSDVNIMLARGLISKILENLNNAVKSDSEVSKPDPLGVINTDEKRNKITEILIENIAEVTGVPKQKITLEKSFEEYGIESIMIVSLNKILEKSFKGLPKTLFFEYKNLNELLEYLLNNHSITNNEKEESSIKQNKTIREEEWQGKANIRFLKSHKVEDKKAVDEKHQDDIAIIGLSGRYPGAESIQEFWNNLAEGKDCIVEIPAERWSIEGFYDSNKNQMKRSYCKWGGFISTYDKFDPLFFKISPIEAEIMDPQERVFLEIAWHTIEDAGYTRAKLKDKNVGVFVGVMWSQYQLLRAEAENKDDNLVPGSSFASIANRVSYHMGFTGPSMAIDTMCSSSLTAISLAYNSIKNNECNMAIAGGVNLSVHPDKYLQISQQGFASSIGKCTSFGIGGDGYVPGEGVGAIMLKRLSQAVKDNDNIYAIIKGVAINHGGKTNGYSVPNPVAQGELLTNAMKQAGIDPESINYIEAHGTGTALGDPIEIAGLSKAFYIPREKGWQCSIGSVKSNIGHLESAAGIAAVTKVLLQLKYKKLVPSLHSKELNPDLKISETPFYVQQMFENWKQVEVSINGNRIKLPRRAGVSSFGAGGSNAHIILEEYNQIEINDPATDIPTVFVFSAKNQENLKVYANNLLGFLLSTLAEKTNNHHFEQIEQVIVKEVSNILNVSIQDIDPELSLFDQGFDFFCLKKLLQIINETFQVKPDYSDSVTIQSIAEQIYKLTFRTSDRLNIGAESSDKQERSSLNNIIYTLQTGREPMDERVAIVCYNTTSLIDLLKKYLGGKGDENIFCGNINNVNHSSDISLPSPNCLNESDVKLLAHAWISGQKIDWESYYSIKPRRIAMPGYPFTRERYWIKTKSFEKASDNTNYNDIKHQGAERINLLIDKEAKEILSFEESWVHSQIISPSKFISDKVILLIDNNEYNFIDLKNKDIPVVLAMTSKEFTKLKQDIFMLDYGNSQHVELLYKTLAESGLYPERFIFSFAVPDDQTAILDVNDQLSATIFSFHNFCKSLINHQLKNEIEILYLISVRKAQIGLFHTSLVGYAKTLEIENPGFKIKIIQIEGEIQSEHPIKVHNYLSEFLENTGEKEIKYQNNERWVRKIGLVNIINEKESITKIRKDGVYVITGGLRGLGFLISKEITSETNATLLIIGRSEIDSESQIKINTLQNSGSIIEYFQGDISKIEDANRIFKEIKSRHKQVNGIVHCAGVLRDSYVLNKSYEEIERVIAAKVYGTIILDELTKTDNLDFFILFSSLTAVIGNAGQSDYAYANRFLDNFAQFRENLRFENLRKGRSISINWPLWLSGGMQISTEQQQEFFELYGMAGMPTDIGIKYWRILLNQDKTNIAVIYGDKEKIMKFLNGSVNYHSNYQANDAQMSGFDLSEKTEAFLQKILSEVFKIPLSKIKRDVGFEDYGIDSIMVKVFNQRMIKELNYDKFSRTLLFEQKTLARLSDCMVQKYKDVLLRNFDIKSSWTIANQNMQVKTDDTRSSKDKGLEVAGDDIAIIGIAGRYPKANDIYSFWENLKNGRDCITLVPKERWDAEQLYDPRPEKSNNGKIYCKWGGFIEDVDQFDPIFFKISPKEAEVLDPQVRLFLETVWSVFEDAGYSGRHYQKMVVEKEKNKVGVFAGITSYTYQIFGSEEKRKEDGLIPSSVPWILTNRISHFFDFVGPSLPVDTACSSSLTAIHLACESIKRDECNLAIAGGVNLYLHPQKYVAMCQLRMLTSSGRCASFGGNADGFVPGEGVGAVLLKPLSKAVADADRIYGIIKGTAINHGGRTNGFTVPNPEAQAELISKALKNARITPDTISYMEAHGTGTVLGDPIEITGLVQAFQNVKQKRSCSIGSVKSNIGHLEAAAGIASLTKVLLQMKYKKLVSSLHSEKLNANIFLEDTPFYVQQELQDWNQMEKNENGQITKMPRRAGISSFGAGGANAHVIIEEFNCPKIKRQETKEVQIIPISARDSKTLKKLTSSLSDYFIYLNQGNNSEPIYLEDIAYTFQNCRTEMKNRVAFLAKDYDEFINQLQEFNSGKTNAKVFFLSDETESNIEESIEIQEPIINKKPEELAQLWVNGLSIDWQILFDHSNAKHVSLPSYPFFKKKYWFKNEIKYDQASRIDEKTESELIQASEKCPEDKFNWGKLAENYNGDEVKLNYIDEYIAVVQLRDVKNRNMLAPMGIAGLISKFMEIEKNESVKVVVVTGYDKLFCMGGTKEGLEGMTNKEYTYADIPFIYKGFLQCKVPVIAAMQGHASGVGFAFGLYADIIILAEQAVYSAVFMKYGFTPGMGATLILEEKLGVNLAKEMLFTAGNYTGKQIKERGGAVLVKDQSEVLDEALKIARQFKDKSLISVQTLKKELTQRFLSKLEPVLKSELDMHQQTLYNKDVKGKIEYYFQSDKTSKADSTNSLFKLKLKNSSNEPRENIKRNSNNKILLKDISAISGITEDTPSLQLKNVKNIREDAEEKVLTKQPSSNQVKDIVYSIVSKILHLDKNELREDIAFGDLGVDSISAVEIIREINQQLNLKMDSVELYNYPAIKDFILHIHETTEYSLVLPNCEMADTRPVDNTKTLKSNDEDIKLKKMLQDLESGFIDAESIEEYLKKAYYEC